MVEATGLEPAASCSQSKHSTKLSYASFSAIRLSQTAFILYQIKFKMSRGNFKFGILHKNNDLIWNYNKVLVEL